MKKYFYKNLALALLLNLSSKYSSGQVQSKLTSEIVVEIKNFSVNKILPSINEIIKEHPSFNVQSYCPGQDLVVLKYDPQIFALPNELANLLEDKGLIVYLKEGLTSNEVSLNCKTKYTRVNNQSK